MCFLTSASSTGPQYLLDIEGNSCGNRAVGNQYFTYRGNSFTTEKKGTVIYLITNPNIVGTDPSPLAFSNLFDGTGSLSATTLNAAQAQFSITYLTGTISTTLNAKMMTASTQGNVKTYFNTPSYNSLTHVLTVSNIQILGGVGSVYFVLVLYKQISSVGSASTVNIRMNQPPTA
jgi:hypothetical protein